MSITELNEGRRIVLSNTKSQISIFTNEANIYEIPALFLTYFA